MHYYINDGNYNRPARSSPGGNYPPRRDADARLRISVVIPAALSARALVLAREGKLPHRHPTLQAHSL